MSASQPLCCVPHGPGRAKWGRCCFGVLNAAGMTYAERVVEQGNRDAVTLERMMVCAIVSYALSAAIIRPRRKAWAVAVLILGLMLLTDYFHIAGGWTLLYDRPGFHRRRSPETPPLPSAIIPFWRPTMSKTESIVDPENEPDLAADPERLLGKVAREHRRDGATDAMLGGLFLTVGLIHARWGSSAFDSGIAPLGNLLLAVAVLVLMLWLWKQKITYPRLGYAKIVTPQWRGASRGKCPLFTIRFSASWLCAAGHSRPVRGSECRCWGLSCWWRCYSSDRGCTRIVATLVAGNVPLDLLYRRDSFKFVWLMCLILVIPILGQAQTRFVMWTVGLVLGLYVATDLLTQSPVWAFLVTGNVFLLIGIVRLINFLRNYPILEVADDAQ